MQDEEITGGQEELDEIVEGTSESSGKYEMLIQDGENKYKLTGMYRDWFLDYASYVILERAVPHITDGFKPVQRRIMHAMKNIDDGRFNKVANIIGQTMQYHPHGDASIGDALVQLGQKDLLVDCQGNWGNILTGDSAAAPRYIEARLSEFAKEVVFNPKTTEWMNSYDGRNQEPVNLPVKLQLFNIIIQVLSNFNDLRISFHRFKFCKRQICKAGLFMYFTVNSFYRIKHTLDRGQSRIVFSYIRFQCFGAVVNRNNIIAETEQSLVFVRFSLKGFTEFVCFRHECIQLISKRICNQLFNSFTNNRILFGLIP